MDVPERTLGILYCVAIVHCIPVYCGVYYWYHGPQSYEKEPIIILYASLNVVEHYVSVSTLVLQSYSQCNIKSLFG